MVVNNNLPNWLYNAFIYHIYPIGFFGTAKLLKDTHGVSSTLLQLRNYYNYFIEMGVNVIQFGPLFISSSHGYDTIDYFNIDPRFGTNKDFKTIVRELHEIGIRVIIDGVFNHVSREFFAFQDLLEKKENSSYKNWFYLDFNSHSKRGDPFNYNDWEGHSELVKLNVENQELKEYLFKAITYWMQECEIDGWRLDVSYLLPQQFLRDLRKVCKQVNPESILIGEMIHGIYSQWVGEHLLDSGTSYQIHKSIWSAIKSKNMHELKNVVDYNFNMNMGKVKDLYLMNFLGNHDTDRIASVLSNDDLIPAFLILFTLNGYPKIYYGDEYGMTGKKTKHSDDEVRKHMLDVDQINSTQNVDLLSNIKKFVKLRKSNEILKHGDINSFYADKDCYAFARILKDKLLIVIVSINDKTISKTIPVGNLHINNAEFFDILNNEEGFKVENNQLKFKKLYYKWGRVFQMV